MAVAHTLTCRNEKVVGVSWQRKNMWTPAQPLRVGLSATVSWCRTECKSQRRKEYLWESSDLMSSQRSSSVRHECHNSWSCVRVSWQKRQHDSSPRCTKSVIVVRVEEKGGAGGEEMNETKAIFSFCFSEDAFVKKKNSDRLKKTMERAE